MFIYIRMYKSQPAERIERLLTLEAHVNKYVYIFVCSYISYLYILVLFMHICMHVFIYILYVKR